MHANYAKDLAQVVNSTTELVVSRASSPKVSTCEAIHNLILNSKNTISVEFGGSVFNDLIFQKLSPVYYSVVNSWKYPDSSGQTTAKFAIEFVEGRTFFANRYGSRTNLDYKDDECIGLVRDGGKIRTGLDYENHGRVVVEDGALKLVSGLISE